MRVVLLLLVALSVAPGALAVLPHDPFVKDEGHWEAWRVALPAGGEAVLYEAYAIDDRPAGRLVALFDADWRPEQLIVGADAYASRWYARASVDETVVSAPKDETYNAGGFRFRWLTCAEACEIRLLVAHAGLPQSRIQFAHNGTTLGHTNGTSVAVLAAEDFEGTYVAAANQRIVREAHVEVAPQSHLLGTFTGAGTTMVLGGEREACDCVFDGAEVRRFEIAGPQVNPDAVLFYADYERP